MRIPPAYAERVFVLHAASPAVLVAALEGRWTPGEAGFSASTDGELAWFVEPDRFFELTAVSFTDTERFADLASAPLWAPATESGEAFALRDEARPLLAAASRRGVDGVDVWATAAQLGDPVEVAVRRRALWLCARDREPPMD